MGFLLGILGFIAGLFLAVLLGILGFFGFVMPGSYEEYDTGDDYGVPPIETIVEPEWLQVEINANPDLVIVALASEADFQAGHIDGAVRIDPGAIEPAGTDAVDWQFNLEELLGESGISPDSTVIIYDHGDETAARLWWAMTRLSHPSVAVLNGGITAWQDAGFEIVEDAIVPPRVSTIYFGFPDDTLVATTEEVEAAIDDPFTVIIDARSASEYAAGHIPGAINIPAASNFDADGRFLTPEALMDLYADAGVTTDLNVIVYCQTGLRSTNTALALQSLGFWWVQIYTGSWDEWSSDPALPVEN